MRVGQSFPKVAGSVFRASIISVLCLGVPVCSRSQVLMHGTGPEGRVRLHTSDLAVFMSAQERKDLPCSVSPNKPVLGFDLRFHSTYEVSIPLRELAGGFNRLSILFRVTPDAALREPVHFIQHIQVPEIEEGAHGDAYIRGSFDVGEGSYKVSWLMRDRTGRICASFWDVEATLNGRDEAINLAIQPGEVRPTEHEQFKDEPPVIRAQGSQRLNIKVLVNFAPQKEHAATLQPFDTSALIAILRTISREPRIGKFSVVAFNLHEQRILFRQDDADRIDFPALGESLDTLKLGTVDVVRLSDKHGETRFLADLIQKELGSAERPDALIFAGPKAMLTQKVSEEDLSQLRNRGYPIFYMNYNLYPYEVPWRDTIGSAVKFLEGQEFTISRPRDLWRAVSEMVSQIVKDKGSQVQTAAASE